MGMFDDIGAALAPVARAISNPVANIGGAIAGGEGRKIGSAVDMLNPENLIRNAVLGKGGGGPAGAPGPAGMDPRLHDALQGQLDYAKEFRSSLPGMQQEAGGVAENQSKRQLAGDLVRNKQNASSRGLLYSGVKQMGDASAQAQSQAGLNAKKFSVNKELEGQANEAEQQAIKAAQDQQNLESDLRGQMYDVALSNANAKRGALGALGGAVGSAVGAGLGKK